MKLLLADLVNQQKEYLIINKKPGAPVHGGKGIKHSLISEVKNVISPDVELIHRLDRDTSGLMMVSRSVKFLPSLKFSLDNGEKTYLLICKGKMRGRFKRINSDIEVNGKSKSAVTKIKLLQGFAGFSLVEATIETGRKHQIRIHMAAIGHPVLGDKKYGDFKLNKKVADRLHSNHLFLHSWKLYFAFKSRPHRYNCLPPDYFKDFLNLYSINYNF